MSRLEDEGIAVRRREIDRMEQLLRYEVQACCPGPHEPRQHRDRKPPWCAACGRDARGVRQADLS